MAEAARKLAKLPRNKVLVVEDDTDLRAALIDTLALAGYHYVEANCAEVALEQLQHHNDIELIISDVNMGAMSGRDLLCKVKQDFPHIPVILITAYASISESVGAMKEGAIDYLVKPFQPEVLLQTLEKYLGAHSAGQDAPIAVARTSQQLLQLAQRVAQSESTVLLVGESGTGKEVLARYIHEKSPRAGKPFIAINCAAIPENMLEAMLFGHEKGAYTGAHTSAPGKFEQANGGTLLLDEISEMELGLQAKLLRVLQEKEVERLGGRKSIKLDVRVIATSNREMRSQVALGKFREDLYFRLSVLPLHWAPLRDRKDDILPLAEQLLSRHANKQHRNAVSFSQEAKQTLLSYPWPGNVRELDNVVQRALILQPGQEIESIDLGLHEDTGYSQKPALIAMPQQQHSHQYPQQHPHQQGLANAETTHTLVGVSAHRDESDALENPVLGQGLRDREFEIILKTLKEQKGSKKRTADALGISPRTLRYKFARLREQGYSFDLFK